MLYHEPANVRKRMFTKFFQFLVILPVRYRNKATQYYTIDSVQLNLKNQ